MWRRRSVVLPGEPGSAIASFVAEEDLHSSSSTALKTEAGVEASSATAVGVGTRPCCVG